MGRIFEDENNLEDINITEQDVVDQIKLLDSSKAYGPDLVPPKILKEGGEIIVKHLTKLFKLTVRKMTIPKLWKQANVIPIYKKDKRTIVNNYRPISLLSVVSKVMERVIFKYVYNHLHDNFILSTYQSGFLPGRSTVTQLIEVYHSFCKSIDRNKEVRVIFLDISKAFDRVWHKGLLHKLQKCGITGNILGWFSNYLSNRQQRVVIEGQFSEFIDINAGVPQGSVLGPLLFLLYINDITHAISNCQIRLFADDTCLFIEVDNREETALLLNHDLESLHKWSVEWLVDFSETKTKSMIISNKKDKDKNPPVFLNGKEIENVRSFSYLGLELTNNMRWNKHIDKISNKAKKRLSAMIPLKLKLSRKAEIMYQAFVRPIIDYCSVIWGGSYDSEITKLEKNQVDALSLITGAKAKSNIEKLNKECPIMQV